MPSSPPKTLVFFQINASTPMPHPQWKNLSLVPNPFSLSQDGSLMIFTTQIFHILPCIYPKYYELRRGKEAEP